MYMQAFLYEKLLYLDENEKM